MDSDLVVVMASGEYVSLHAVAYYLSNQCVLVRAVECDAPHALLQKPGSYFASMLAELPEDERDILAEVALKKEIKRFVSYDV